MTLLWIKLAVLGSYNFYAIDDSLLKSTKKLNLNSFWNGAMFNIKMSTNTILCKKNTKNILMPQCHNLTVQHLCNGL